MGQIGLGFFLAVSLCLWNTQAKADDNGVPVHGFADIIAGSSGSETPEEEKLRGFGVGNIDFYLTPDFGNRVKALFELVLEPGAGDGGIAIDIERSQLGYTFNDNTTLWVGRFHTPFGSWNTAFHHGGQLQTTVFRPRFIDFEDKGGMLPAHSVGAWLHGSVPVNSDKIVYDLYSANGPRITGVAGGVGGTLDFNLIKSDHQSGLLGLNLAYRFGGGLLDGLQAGVHGFTTPVHSYANSTYGSAKLNSVDVQMTGAYIFYEGDHFEVDAEYYAFNNKDATTTASSDKWSSSLYFVEAGLPLGNWKPYVVYEKTVLDKDDLFFNQQGSFKVYARTSVGFKYDLDASAAVKFEAMSTVETAPDDIKYTTWVTQYAVRF